ncbi:MAG TPA: T9SS type A sorting domain-containing protein [bacterium]|jgi:hypothetical protein
MRSFLILLLIATATLAATPQPQTAFFVQNEGQWDGAFAFKYDAPGATYFLTSSGLTLDLHSPEPRTAPDQLCHPEARLRAEGPRASLVHGHVLKLSYINANPTPILTGEDKLPSYSNYFLSKDSCKWRSRVGHYRSVTAQDVWPGIDVEYRIAPSGVETVYRLHPGADPSLIQLRYEGQDTPLAVDANGSLLLSTSLGAVTEAAPFAYQNINHTQVTIPCRYELTAEGGYRFVLGAYDVTKEVVIDPVVYCSYWGGGFADAVEVIIQDHEHHKVLYGDVNGGEFGFPTTPGAYRETSSGWCGFLSKFNADGDSLLFSTFLGGVNHSVRSAVCDAQNAVYVTGDLDSVGINQYPLTPDAFDTTWSGPSEGFFARISSDGATLEFSSYLGGSGRDLSSALAADSAGLIYVSGTTSSPDFPLSADALYRDFMRFRSGFFSVFDPQSSALRYSTYFPGTLVEPLGLTVQAGQQVWIYGDAWHGGIPITANAYQPDLHGQEDAFFALLDWQADTLLYSSYIGGIAPPDLSFDEWINYLLPLGGDTVVLCGSTYSRDFPTSPDGFDTVGVVDGSYLQKAFLTMLRLPGTLLHGTLLGGLGALYPHFAVDAHGAFLAAGMPYDRSFPLTADAEDTTLHSMFVSRLSHDLRRLEYSTFLGGDAGAGDYINSVLYEPGRGLWLTGSSESHDFPVTPNALIPTDHGVLGYGYYLCYALPGDTDITDATSSVILPPSSFSLSCFPNPFNPTTTLSFTLPASSEVKLEVFDLLGRSVYQQNLGRMSAGEHQHRFDATALSSGIYFAKLHTATASQIRKLVLLK